MHTQTQREMTEGFSLDGHRENVMGMGGKRQRQQQNERREEKGEASNSGKHVRRDSLTRDRAAERGRESVK